MLDGIGVPSIPTCGIHTHGLQPPLQIFFTPGPIALEMIDESPYRDAGQDLQKQQPLPLSADLALRTELLQESSALPGPSGTRRLYHAVTPEGRSSWVWETVTADATPIENADRSWTLSQSFLDVSGKPLAQRDLRVALRGKRFYEEVHRSDELLDLGSFDSDLELRIWQPAELPEN